MHAESYDARRSPPPYEHPPPWVPPQQRSGNPDYDNDLRLFLPRKVCLRRQRITDTLGFNIRGGDDDILGMFVTGILEVNGVSFERIDHSQAVSALKNSLEVNMVLRFFPYMYKNAMERKRPNEGPPNAQR